MAAALGISRMLISIFNGMSSVKDVQHTYLDLGAYILRDMDFVDDAEIMLAVSNESTRAMPNNPVKRSLLIDGQRLQDSS